MRSLYLTLLVALLSLSPRPSAAEGVDEELIRTEEKMAELYESKEDLASALRIWRELLAAHGENPRYLDQVSRLALELKLYDEALGPAKKLVRLEPQSSAFRTRLVSVLVASNQLGEALPHLEWLKQRAPSDPAVRLDLAAAYEAMKKPAEALVHYDWLVAREPRRVEVRQARAAIYGELNREREQLAELKLLLTLVQPPGTAELHRQLGEILYQRESFDEAEIHLQAAIRVAPADVGSRVLLDRIRKGREEARRRAMEEYRQAERYQDLLADIQERSEDF